ncbi:MAG TPA: hypothetical protein VF053_16005 [Streptosporangiales bacterium]
MSWWNRNSRQIAPGVGAVLVNTETGQPFQDQYGRYLVQINGQTMAITPQPYQPPNAPAGAPPVGTQPPQRQQQPTAGYPPQYPQPPVPPQPQQGPPQARPPQAARPGPYPPVQGPAVGQPPPPAPGWVPPRPQQAPPPQPASARAQVPPQNPAPPPQQAPPQPRSPQAARPGPYPPVQGPTVGQPPPPAPGWVPPRPQQAPPPQPATTRAQVPPQNPPQARQPGSARRLARFTGRWARRGLTHPRTTRGLATLAGSVAGFALGTAIAGPAGAIGVYPGMAAAWGIERALRTMAARARARRALQPGRTPDTPQVSGRKAARLRSRNRSHGRHRASGPRKGRGIWSRKQRSNSPEIKANWWRLYVSENIRWGSLQGIGGMAVAWSAHNFGLMKGYLGIVPVVSVITATQSYLAQKKVSAKEHQQNERHSAAAERDVAHERRLDGHEQRMEAMGAVLQKMSQGQPVSQAEMAAALGTPAPGSQQAQPGQQVPQPGQRAAQTGQQVFPPPQPAQYPQPQPAQGQGGYQPGSGPHAPPRPPAPPTPRYSRERISASQQQSPPGQQQQPRQPQGGQQAPGGGPQQPGQGSRHARGPRAEGGRGAPAEQQRTDRGPR